VDGDGDRIIGAVGMEARFVDLLSRYAAHAALARSTDASGPVIGWSTLSIRNIQRS